MNKSYRTVHNASTGTWVAAPETAKGRSKSSRKAALTALSLAAAIGSALDSADVHAFVPYGTGATSGLASSTVVGDNASASAAALTCGYPDPIRGTVPCTGATVIGNAASSAFGATTVVGDNATTTGSYSVAIGSNALAYSYSQAIGHSAYASGDHATAIGQSAVATMTDATAIGTNAKATGLRAISLGSGATASATDAFALGWGTKATGVGSMAFGTSVQSTGNNAIAMGSSSTAAGDNSFALGRNSAASGDSAMAMGYGANVNASATYGVAVGRNATVTSAGANSVALGQASVADRANAVSVGSAAQTRQMTYLAAGTAATDAVNVSQLQSVTNALGGGAAVNPDGTIAAPNYSVGGTTVNNVGDAITNLDGRTTQNAGDITNLTDGLNNGTIGLVRQDPTKRTITVAKATDGALVDFTGTAGARQLTGIAAGNVNATSLDAVNGSQLYGTANSVANAIGGGSTVNPDGTISAPSYAVGGTTVNNVGDAITNLDGRTTQNTGDIANIANNLNNGTIGLVQQDPTARTITVAKATDGALVDFTGTAGARQLTGVAAGNVNATSLDAVNGSQLYSTANSVANAIGGGSTVNPDGTISAPSYAVGGTTVNNVGDAITNLDGRTTQNAGDITNITNNLNNGTIGLVQQDPTARTITVAKATDGALVDFTGTAGARQLTGVAAGNINATSLDAVNGSQLYGTANSVANAIGGGSTVNPDGTISAPSYAVGGTTVNSVGDAITNLDGRTTQNTGDIANITNNLNNGSIGLVQQDAATRTITVAKATDGALVDFTGTAGARQLTGVADGVIAAGSLFAVNGGQLFGVSSSIANAMGGGSVVNPNGTISAPVYNVGGTTVNNVGAAITNLDGRVTNVEGSIANVTNQINNGEIGLVKQDANTGNITVASDKGGKTVDMSGTAGARQITGVADGAIAQGSTDAVNGGQIYSMSQQINQLNAGSEYFKADGSPNGNDAAAAKAGTNSVAMGANASAQAMNSVALGANSVADRDNTVSVGSAGNERVIANVADAVAGTDAVNKRTLDGAMQSAKSYTDQRMNQVQGMVGDVARKAYAGVAAATALTMIPDVDLGKTVAVGIGASQYQGYAATAIGVSARLNERIKVKAGVGVSASGTTAGVGASYQW